MAQQESALQLQLEGYRLATAEIVYHLPDHPGLLQSFIWQHYDVAPRYPVLHRFLAFWRREIVAVVHSVYVGRKPLIGPSSVTHAHAELRLH
jgi:uncharacterized protein Usg